jgi:hypothetical protein
MPPKKNTKSKSGRGKSTAKAPAEVVTAPSMAKPASSTGIAVPKLKIHPPKRLLAADTPEEEDSDSSISPPPPVDPAKVKAAVEELLGQWKPLSRANLTSDEDSDDVASNYSNKRKRAASDAISEAPDEVVHEQETAATSTTAEDEDDEHDELEEDTDLDSEEDGKTFTLVLFQH